MSETKEIVFDPINIEEESKKQQLIYNAKVWKMENNKKTYPENETGFMYHQYSQFASKMYYAPDKRDFIKVPIYDTKSCKELEQELNTYDEILADSKNIIFGKYAKYYTQVNSVKETKSEVSITDEGSEPKHKPKFAKFKLNMAYNYYLNDEKLDFKNSSMVRNYFKNAREVNKGKDKDTIFESCIFNLKFKDENNKEYIRVVKGTEIEQRKDIITPVFYRSPDPVKVLDIKKNIEDFSEDELTELFGKGEIQKVTTPDELDKFYTNGVYIRFIYTPRKVWCSHVKNKTREFSYQFVCTQIDIINTKKQFVSTNTNQYLEYKFGKNKVNNTLIKEDTVDSVDKTDSNVHSVQTKPTKSTKSTQQVVVDEEVDEVDGEEQEAEVEVEAEAEAEAEADGEEQEEEEDITVVETKPVPKSKGKIVQVEEEKPKSKVIPRKTK